MDLKAKTGRGHVSYSSLNSWMDCGWRFYLTRVQQQKETGAWWFVGGKAVHTATELYDLGESADVNLLWSKGWETALQESIEQNGAPYTWRAGGRATKEFPNGNDGRWWQANGPAMVQAWIDWRRTSGFELLEFNGQPAVELDVSVSFSDDVIIKGFIDRVFLDTTTGEIVVLDLKTGTREPESAVQLGVYAALMDKVYGTKVTSGAFWMARKGTHTGLYPLTQYTPDVVESWLHAFVQAIDKDVFIPHPSSMCRTCGVADKCFAVGGANAHLFPALTLTDEGAMYE